MELSPGLFGLEPYLMLDILRIGALLSKVKGRAWACGQKDLGLTLSLQFTSRDLEQVI